MPIHQTKFDESFQRLGLSFVVKGQCSWQNYQEFNSTLRTVQSELQALCLEQEIRLVDAHTFCWMLVHPVTPPRQSKASRSSRRGKVDVFSRQQIAIVRMVKTTVQTVRASNGQQAEKNVKAKELRMTEMQLEQYVSTVLRQQGGRCALSGMPLIFDDPAHPRTLWASLDRIDSDGHYERENLQVVCRFLNMWKQSMGNDEFCELLERLRQHWIVDDYDDQ